MKPTATPTADHRGRPLLVLVAHRWYSWAGLVFTVAVAYLAANGTLRLGDSPGVRAAGPEPVSWKPTASPQLRESEGSRIELLPVSDAGNPFHAAPPVADTEVKPAPSPGAGGFAVRRAPAAQPLLAPPIEKPPLQIKRPGPKPGLPDPFVAPPGDVKAALNGRVAPVLDAYVKDKAVIPAKAETPGQAPKITPMPLALPSVPQPIAAAAESRGMSPERSPLPPAESPKSIPAQLPPLSGPVVRPPKSPATAGPILPPIPPPPTGGAPEVRTETTIRPPTRPAASKVVPAQDVEVIPVRPRLVGKAEEKAPGKPDEKKEPPPRKRKLIGTLSQDDEIRLNAAQNAVRLGDFNRAAALMGEVIARNPDEYDLRAEYAGILLSAGDPRGAIRELEQVIKVAPNVAAYRLLLGDAYVGAGQFRAAADVFMSVLEMVGSDPRLADRVPEVAIRAARAYALAQEYFRAAHLVDRHLSGIRPEDPRAPLAMGSILLDLDRPFDALPYLIEKRKQLLASPEASEEYEVKVLDVLASLARAYARLGDRQQAMDAIQEMAARAPKQAAVRISLGDILFDLNEHELAGHVYNQVLAVDPANGPALTGIARVYLETFQTSAAKQILDSFVPNAANQRHYLVTYASYHQAVGEYAEAKQIYREMLRRNENDHEVRFALGRLYDLTSEWEKAKGEFAKIPPQDKMARRARLGFGFALLHQRKFAEAAQAAEQFVRDDPNNAEALALFVRALAKMGQFDRAVQGGRGYLAGHQRDERGATTVRLAVARALLDANRNLDAAREYEIALSKPAGRVPEAYYGLSRAAEKLGVAERARQIIDTLCGPAGADFRNRLLMADFYAQDFEDQKVIDIITSFAGYDNNNLALLVRLADAQQRVARWSGDPADAFATAQTILRKSPTNVRGHLVMARSFALAQDYRKAAVQYEQLLAIDPDYTVPARERARALYSDRQYSAARTQYNVALSPSAEEQVAGQMAYLAQHDAKFNQAFGSYLATHVGGPALRGELSRMAGTSVDEEVRLAAHRLVCDYDATLAWQEAFRLERDAKEFKDYRNYMAVPLYEAINQFEPTNTETLFDQGQVFGALQMTRAALTWYQNTLAVDPTYRDAAVASERASAEISPKLDLRADFFRQRGRQGLASIDRQRYVAAASLPLGDEDEFLQLGYMRLGYNPLDDPQFWGNAPFARVQKKWDDNRLMTYAQVNVEQFRDGEGFSTRPTFDAGFWYDHDDVVRCRGGAFLENVAENGESVRQDIYRYGVYGGADVRPTRVWTFGALYTFAHYSDDNDAHFGYLFNEVSLSLPPKQLKLVQRVNLWSFRDQTVFATPIPNPYDLRGTVHPYFAPDFFSSCECRVEWWHWLSRDYFVHSNQCWYSLQYGIATDNSQVTYHNFRALFNYDVNSCLTVGAEAQALNSSAYDMYSAMVYLQVRFLGQ